MKTFSRVTPITYRMTKNLAVTDYMFIYMNEDKKLKRAIPDFEEKFFDSSDSLINEVFNADKIGVFRILYKNERATSPVFNINISEDGTVESYNNYVELENFLLDSKRRETVSKMLKKTK